MRVTFVGLGWEQLGISLLAAIARRDGHEVHLAFSSALFNDRYNLSVPALASYFDDRREVLAAIRRQRPDVLACSPLTGTYQWMLGVAAEAKAWNPRLKVVFGGVHASAVSERVLARGEVDYVCVGEGDVAFPSILRAISEGGAVAPIVNTRFKLPDGKIVLGPQDGFIQDLDALPVFDKTLWEEHMRVGDIYFTMASRGCPYRCTFCFNSYFARLPQGPSGKYVRQRGVEHMMSELRFARRRYKLRIVEFEDDVFTVNKKWLKEFLWAYKKEIAVPFQCLTHPRYMDNDVAGWLREAGCVYVQMGIQTMDDDFKRSTINRLENTREVEQALEVMRRHRISPKVDHMFGLPGEPLAAQETARQLYVRHPPYRIQTFWTNYFPGTELTRRAVSDGTITPAEAERLYDGIGFDFYRESSRGIEAEKLKAFRGYEILFKLIPVLPLFLRRRLSAAGLGRLPPALGRLISFMTDALSGLVRRNPDHWGYARHYGYHMFRCVGRKLGLKVPPATRPLPVSAQGGESHLLLPEIGAGADRMFREREGVR